VGAIHAEANGSHQRLAIISDTHMPAGRRELPAGCVARLRQADLIIHAGDFTGMSVLEQLRGLGPDVAAVHGNRDSPEVVAALPERLELTVGGARLGLVHDGGRAAGRLQRARRAFPGCDAVIFGHSHIPLLETEPGSGVQIFNPGSPTDKRRQPHYTMGWAEAGAGGLVFGVLRLER
jgi:putative phosphoesterase